MIFTQSVYFHSLHACNKMTEKVIDSKTFTADGSESKFSPQMTFVLSFKNKHKVHICNAYALTHDEIHFKQQTYLQ